ncbi:MAG: hypothetical protein IPM53_19540 [Anaerolineaceae bacterium]|nr:hypothetical protein [Anaerolineaceae bacterium]
MKELSPSERSQILKAIDGMLKNVRWVAGSAERHLQKRIARGHLPAAATIEDYEHVIRSVLQDESAQVFRYWYNRKPYLTLVTAVQSRQWLVMFSYDSLMETAFIIERPEQYLNKPGFEEIGSLREVQHEL